MFMINIGQFKVKSFLLQVFYFKLLTTKFLKPNKNWRLIDAPSCLHVIFLHLESCWRQPLEAFLGPGDLASKAVSFTPQDNPLKKQCHICNNAL